LNEAIVADGTAEAIETAKQGIIDGTVQVFAGPLKGTGDNFGTAVSIDIPEGEYYTENETASAPSWCYIIDGITIVE